MAQHRQCGMRMHLLVGQEPVQRINTRNWLAAIPNNDIAFQNPSALGRAVGFNGHHQDAAYGWQVLQTHEATRESHILPAYSDIAAPDSPVFDEATGHEDRSVHRNGET